MTADGASVHCAVCMLLLLHALLAAACQAVPNEVRYTQYYPASGLQASLLGHAAAQQLIRRIVSEVSRPINF